MVDVGTDIFVEDGHDDAPVLESPEEKELIGHSRDPHHRHTVVKSLYDAVHPAVGDEQLRPWVGCSSKWIRHELLVSNFIIPQGDYRHHER